ncbi:MAG: hypothetical protein ACRDRL_08475, partial [Sciscionella sp.]
MGPLVTAAHRDSVTVDLDAGVADRERRWLSTVAGAGSRAASAVTCGSAELLSACEAHSVRFFTLCNRTFYRK